MKKSAIAAVVVTYNRLPLLQECIAAIRSQQRPVEGIVVINNGCTDGTAEWLSTQAGVTVVTQPNGGSSGGQYTAIRYAVENNFDWVWCMDDDTVPTSAALEALVNSPLCNDAAAYLCSVVLWKDDTFHQMNRPLLKAGHYEETYYPGLASSEIVNASFVSIMINSKAVKVAGYPLKKMFIWFDDLEYTIRLGKYGPCYLIGNSVVYHKTEENVGPDFLPRGRSINAKELLGIRNYLFVRKNIYPFDKRKTKHLYLYLKTFAAILKYGVVTRQFSKVLKYAIAGLLMNKKQR